LRKRGKMVMAGLVSINKSVRLFRYSSDIRDAIASNNISDRKEDAINSRDASNNSSDRKDAAISRDASKRIDPPKNMEASNSID
jgi:hypothetical protein